MSRRTDRGSLMEMRDYAQRALDMFREASADDLEANSATHYALRYLVLAVGEAASRVSDKSRAAHPEIPWVEAIGMRNVLAHGYDQMDRERLHDTVAVELPALVRQLDTILGEE